MSNRNEIARARREKYINKLGGVCVKCGTTDDIQFDHIDPKSKTMRLSNSWLMSEERLDKEVEKCQLLCIVCHSKKTATDNGRMANNSEHNLSTYKNKNKRCRCEICRNASNEYQKSYYARLGRQKKNAPLVGKSGW